MYLKAYKTTRGPSGELVTALTDYAEIARLSFAPSADLTATTLPADTFEADIRTADAIDVGAYAELYDDADTLWASYWVVSSERVGGGMLRLRAASPVALLDRALLPATRYEGRGVTQALEQILNEDVRVPYRLDPAFEGATLTGFCPAQSPRERLLWVCFAIGAFVRASFNTRLEILPVPTASRLIPAANTYWRPALSYGDWVTAVRVRAYEFAVGDPGPADRYVTSGTGVNYIVTHRDYTLRNPDAPEIAPENVVSVEDVTLINPDNVSDALSRLARWAFCRARAELDVIDNGDIRPGDLVAAPIDAGLTVTGYVDRAAFSFGKQARAALRLTGVSALPTAALTLRWLWGGVQLGRAEHWLPVGCAYAVENPHIDWTMNGHRIVFRPLNALAEGIMPEGGAADDEPCEPALDWRGGVLDVLCVDELTESEGTVKLS